MFNENQLETIHERLMGRKESVAVAESVTAGLLACAIAQAKDASCFFQGGITAYNLGQKVLHLNVEPIQAAACDCVSEKTAADMARSVADRFRADWGIGITGYAASTQAIKTPFALYVISYRGQVTDAGKIESDKEPGWNTQKYFVSKVLEKFVAVL